MTPVARQLSKSCTAGVQEVLAQLAVHAEHRGSHAAIHDRNSSGAERVLSWSDLYLHAHSFADRLRSVHTQKNIVLLSCTNRAEFIVAFLAVLLADGWVMPVYTRHAPAELRRISSLAKATAIVGADESIAALSGTGIREFGVESLLDSPVSTSHSPHNGVSKAGLLLQSSGTTGMPRIAARSARSLDAVARNVCIAAGLSPDDEVLACIPLGHSYGVENALLGPILAGSCIRLVDGFDPHVILHHMRSSATVFPGVPFMFEAISRIARPDDRLRTLRLAYSAGGAMPRAVASEFERCVGLGVGQLYGATEIGSVTFTQPACSDFDPACAGVPLPGVHIRVLDPGDPDPRRPLPVGSEGHIAVSAPSMLDGYVDGDAPVRHGFFLTGDLGRLDDRNRLWITGRLKLQIDVGGLKVNPAEVESALLEHPAVVECVVVCMPLTDTISRVRAIVVRRNDAPSTPEELRRFLGTRLAPYKIPRVIEFRESLPRSAAGKILRKEVELSEGT